MAQYFDISDWKRKDWYSTKGTRNKSVVQNPDSGIDCYFKTSLNKPNKNYKSEFWSEIISSELGRFLGFDVLKYDIAFCDNEMGCISEFMNIIGESELTEGVQYLTGYDSTYKPEQKDYKSEYTFEFICDALKAFEFQQYIHDIIKITIFDSLIGNSDRHQENWGIITFNQEAVKRIKRDVKDKNIKYLRRFLMRLSLYLIINYPKLSSYWKKKLHHLMPNRFAPIYDSGSCLGRELLDEKVIELLSDENKLKYYVKRGKSEIHWYGKKVTHFQLIKNISQNYATIVNSEIQRVISTFDMNEIQRIVNEIDKHVPLDKKEYKLPDERKELIIKMVSLRYNELCKLKS